MEVEDRATRADHPAEPQQFEYGHPFSGISAMSDSKLLRVGISAKFRCLQSDCKQRASLTLQLEEARKEWNRRHPFLPLVDSF